MSDIPTKTYPPSFLHALIADHEIERLKNALDHLTSERDEARAEVERLTAHHSEMETHITGLTDELHRTRANGITLRWAEGEVEQLTAQRDAAKAERDAAQAEVKRLTKERNNAKADLEWLRATQSVQNLNTANGQAILDSSRPTDEDIWREAFMAAMERGGVFDRMTVADLALAEYRKRWPR
jgi:chromosome segregation ATPase